MDGSPRPQGPSFDIGAYEFARAPVIISGLTTAQQDLILLNSQPAASQLQGTAVSPGRVTILARQEHRLVRRTRIDIGGMRPAPAPE